MQDPSLALVAICGFSLICISLIAIVGLLVLRFTGRSIGGLLGGEGLYGLVDSVSGASDPEESALRTGQRRAPANDLRARAQSLDFDSAVAHYKAQPPGAPTATPSNPYPPLQPEPDENPNPDASAQRKRRRRGEDDADADEMFGGFLDEIDPF